MDRIALKVAVVGASLVASATAGSSGAFAQTTSGTLNVSATVTANCTVSTTPLAFGNVNTLSGSNVDGAGGISVTCTNGTPWEASAGIGSGTGASFAARVMADGSDLLTYNLYTDATRNAIWGDGTGSSSTISNTGSGVAQSVTIYGRVGSGQTSAPAGSYADTVAVTVSY